MNPPKPSRLPPLKERKTMLEVTSASIIKDGKPVMTFDVNDTIDEVNIDLYRQKIKARYAQEMVSDVQVYLKYKNLDGKVEGQENQE